MDSTSSFTKENVLTNLLLKPKGKVTKYTTKDWFI